MEYSYGEEDSSCKQEAPCRMTKAKEDVR